MTHYVAAMVVTAATLFAQSAAQWALKGSRELEAGNTEAARSALESALAADPAQFDALSGLGFLHYQAGRFAEARGLLERAVRVRPASFQSRFLLGATLVGLGEAAAAVPHLQRAVAVQPGHADARKLLAAQLIALQRFREALAALPAPLRRDDEECELLRIEALQGAGDAPGALATAERAAAQIPRSAQIASWLGFQMQFAGRFAEARRHLERAIELDASLPMPYQLLGEVSLKEEKFAEAVRWLREAQARLPGEDAELVLALSRAQEGAGDTPAAIETLERSALEDARLPLQLSRLYYKSGDETRARAAAERSLAWRAKRPVTSRARVPGATMSPPSR